MKTGNRNEWPTLQKLSLAPKKKESRSSSLPTGGRSVRYVWRLVPVPLPAPLPFAVPPAPLLVVCPPVVGRHEGGQGEHPGVQGHPSRQQLLGLRLQQALVLRAELGELGQGRVVDPLRGLGNVGHGHALLGDGERGRGPLVGRRRLPPARMSLRRVSLVVAVGLECVPHRHRLLRVVLLGHGGLVVVLQRISRRQGHQGLLVVVRRISR